MLVLTRKQDESIIINDNIEIKIIHAEDGKVRLGIAAPKSIKINRKEVYDQIIEENKGSKLATSQVDKLKDYMANKK